MKSWIFLLLAITLEVCGTTSMKLSAGFTRVVWTVSMFLCYVASLSCLTMALKGIELSTAYAVWSGLGTALIASVGFVYFREAVTPLKLASIALIIAGVVGLKVAAGPAT